MVLISREAIQHKKFHDIDTINIGKYQYIRYTTT